MSRRFLFRLFAAVTPAGDHVSDRELLRRFVGTRDSAAFELIVRRHADAVWAAGFRVLANTADAEDVFQATFLALVRKAGSVRDTCVGGWLHRVAVNAALKLKARRERERPEERELRSLTLPPRQDPGSPEHSETASIVHQELARLPDRYRLPVVLCDLEGQTHAEAAKTLGWPVGSVSGRLSRAHTILRDRLTRRGLAAPAALVAATTAPTVVVNAATAIATGTATTSPVVSSLTEGVLSAMRIAKLKLTAAVVAATGIVVLAGVGTGYSLGGKAPPITHATEAAIPRTVAAGQPPVEGDWTPKQGTIQVNGKAAQTLAPTPPTAFPDLKRPEVGKQPGNFTKLMLEAIPRLLGDDPPAVVATDDTYRRLLKARLHQGRLYLVKVIEVITIGNWNPAYTSELFLCLTDMQAAVIELWGNEPKILIPWLEELVVMNKYVEWFYGVRVSTGNEPPQSFYAAQRRRLEAEAILWKAKKRE